MQGISRKKRVIRGKVRKKKFKVKERRTHYCPNPSALGLYDNNSRSWYEEQSSSTDLVLAQAQRWVLELLNGLLVKITVFLPQLQQLGKDRENIQVQQCYCITAVC